MNTGNAVCNAYYGSCNLSDDGVYDDGTYVYVRCSLGLKCIAGPSPKWDPSSCLNNFTNDCQAYYDQKCREKFGVESYYVHSAGACYRELEMYPDPSPEPFDWKKILIPLAIGGAVIGMAYFVIMSDSAGSAGSATKSAGKNVVVINMPPEVPK